LREGVIKIAALLSYCGGPLILADVLKPHLGVPVAFGVTFLPIVLMILAAPSLEGRSWRWDGLFVRPGIYGAWMSLAMHAYGGWILATAAVRSLDFGLYVVGLIVGIPIAIWYVISANRWLSRVEAHRNDPTPIEPR
jgi:hypothetical protein